MQKLTSTNPGRNYEIVGEVPITSEKEVKDKVNDAEMAKKKWKETSIADRVNLLRRIVNGMRKNKDELAELITREMGMPITDSRIDIDDATSFFEWYLNHAEEYLAPEIIFENEQKVHTIYREPFGVAAVITPWNFPASNFVWGAGQNLVSGNVVVFKHSEECPLFAQKLNAIIQGSGLPKGVFSMVFGDGEVGDTLVHQNIDLISFTGSTEVGKHLYRVAAEKFIRIVMELGGSSPGIVFEDADLEAVIDTLYINRFVNCGQACGALKRLIVHQSRYEEVVDMLVSKIQEVKVGDPLDPNTQIGPLVSEKQRNTLVSQVREAVEQDAQIIIGGKQPEGLQGAYYEPTLMTNVNRKMRVWQEEVFGPVLPIVTFNTDEEAVQLANDTHYGLGAYIFTQDSKRAVNVASGVDAGMVGINNAGWIEPCSPFGGYKESGIGREHGIFGFHELTQIKLVASEKQSGN